MVFYQRRSPKRCALAQGQTHIERGSIGQSVAILDFTQMMKLMRRWSERAKQRRHLATLTRTELDDVGISTEAAAAEVAKPFWRK